MLYIVLVVFFFNDTATTEIYTLSLHDALPISVLRGHAERTVARGRERGAGTRVRAAARSHRRGSRDLLLGPVCARPHRAAPRDRKSTRLNSSHANISYAVFCLKKKNTIQ